MMTFYTGELSIINTCGIGRKQVSKPDSRPQ